MSAECCSHKQLHLDVSPNAVKAGHVRPNSEERTAAAKPKSNGQTKYSGTPRVDPSMFPAPLVLPLDDLALDPEFPPQDMQQWLDEEERNEVTTEKKVVYIAAPPKIYSEVECMHQWTIPEGTNEVEHPEIRDLIGYLTAFYHGLAVKLLPTTLHFTAWEEQTRSRSSSWPRKKQKQTSPRIHLGLQTSSETIRIRARHNTNPIFPHQLNLDDLLDVAISVLPDDAYALLLLVHHDIYENGDDEFTCGRAYGGSRVAVVSCARYNPELDEQQGVEREHAWPASHCSTYVETCCKSARGPRRARSSRKPSPRIPAEGSNTTSPMQAAVEAYSHHLYNPQPSILHSLFLARICRVASHELGHCFGIDHCVYYACGMQGSASLAEDVRQPMYLCPVDLAKLLRATGAEEKGRYKALLEFCERQVGPDFKAYEAWLKGVLGDP